MSEDPELRVYVDAEGNQRAERRDDTLVCDFCTAPNPTWEYPCGQVAIAGHRVITESDDEWAACDRCHELIEAGNLPRLAVESVRRQRRYAPPGARFPPPRMHLRAQMENVSNFDAARSGPPRRLTGR